jgi:hypothetical protein
LNQPSSPEGHPGKRPGYLQNLGLPCGFPRRACPRRYHDWTWTCKGHLYQGGRPRRGSPWFARMRSSPNICACPLGIAPSL